MPKLNALGVAFRNNGYRIPEGEQRLTKIKDVELGAEPWKDLWPDGIWPGAIPGMPPLAFRLSMDAHVNPSSDIPLDFDMPHEVEFLIAGTSGESISYLAHVDFFGVDDSIALERAFIQFDSLADKTLLNVRVGRMENGAVPFSRFHRRLTAFDYITTTASPFPGAFSFRVPQDGIEVWGVKSGARGGGLEYRLGVVNGGSPGRDTNGAKDWYFRASYKLSGYGVAGPQGAPEGRPAAMRSRDNWSDDSLRIGGYGYRGELATGGLPDSFERLGLDFDLWYKRMNVYGTWMHGREFKGRPDAFDFDAYFIEADYVLYPWLHPLLRLEHLSQPGNNTSDLVVGAVALIRANLRLVGEAKLFFNDSGDSRARFRLDLVF